MSRKMLEALDRVFDTMIDQEETWYCYETGAAFIMSDCSLMDN